MPAPDRKIPAYVSRPRLIEELDICDRTLDNYLAKGFPKASRHGKWNWAKVCRYMDGDDEKAVASEGQSDQLEEIFNASKAYCEGRGHVRRGAARVREQPELHKERA